MMHIILYLMIPLRIENTEGVKTWRNRIHYTSPIMKEMTKKLNNSLIDLSHLFSEPKDHDRIYFGKGSKDIGLGKEFTRLMTAIND